MNSKPFMATPALSHSRWYMGGLITFLATGGQTGGEYALFEATVRKGEEVPFHTHSREDESLYILDGEITCHLGEETFQGRKGDLIFLPRHIKHAWRAESDTLRFLVLITPAGFEQTFLELSEPARVRELPPSSEAPSEELLERVIRRENEFGVWYDFQGEVTVPPEA